jgi:hypothetical protein
MNRLALALLVVPAFSLAQAPAAAPAPAPAPAAAAAVAPQPAAAQAITVAEAKVGTGIESLELVGEATTFPAGIGKVYCWTKVTGGAGQSIVHAWYFNGAKLSGMTLPLRYDSVRTYSYKSITAELKGAWKVEISGPDGAVLKTVEFQVTD